MDSSKSQDEDQITRAADELKQGTFLANAQARSRRRKSPWNLLMFALMFPAMYVLTVNGHRLIWALHVTFHPQQRGTEAAFWRQGMDLARFLMALPMWFAALPVAMLIVNFVIYHIPPARRAMQAEDRGYKGVDYVSSQRAIARVALWMVSAAAVLVTIGAAMKG